MRLIRSARQMSRVAARLRRAGRTIGLVPTMGALHEGHLSLVRRARAENDVTIVTIFVNPAQFGPREDFTRYPRPLRRDLALLRKAGASVVFVPSVREIYPPGFQSFIEPGALARRWEGQRRPGHFRGVATIVSILFHLTQPTTAYFGQKDYQQARVIQQMVRDLRMPMSVRILPTVREADGLAMSSRNQYLTASQRRQAAVLYRALRAARARIRSGERRAAALQQTMRRVLVTAPAARIDYVAVVEADTLKPLARVRGRVALLLAVWIGRTRLIDNLLVDV